MSNPASAAPAACMHMPMHGVGSRLECTCFPIALVAIFGTPTAGEYSSSHQPVTENSASASRPEEVLLMSSMQSDLMLRGKH